MYLSSVRPRRAINSHKPYGKHGKLQAFEDDHDKKRCATCSENFRFYLESSSLHGLKYVGDQSISKCERFFFLVSFVVVVLMSLYFISNVWEKWSASPIIIGLNPIATPIKDIPFPAVTICNVNQAKRNVATHIKPGTVQSILLQSVCAQQDTIITTKSKGKWSVFQPFLQEITQPCSEMILSCRYASKKLDCGKIFSSILTDEGICCSFNALAPQYMFANYNASSVVESVYAENIDDGDSVAVNWTPETGYPSDNIISTKTYPRPIAGTGSHMGLSITLNAMLNDYFCSSTNAAGFKILLHSPVETPKIAEYGFSIETGLETRIAVQPAISDASEIIRRVPIKIRQCLFASEANLTYFKTYSKKNCEMECESHLTEKVCGCVLYFMPRNTEDAIICSRDDAKCYKKIKLAIDLTDNETFTCRKCLPGCSEISYRKTISTAIIGNGSFEIRDRQIAAMNPDFVKENIALVHLFMMDSSFRSSTKGELIGFTEFLSNTGGLLGLFMGFSVLSLIEIFYFLGLYPYCVKKRQLVKQTNVSKFIIIGKKRSQVQSETTKWNRIKVATTTGALNAIQRIKNVGAIIQSEDSKFLNRVETPSPQYPYIE